MYFRPSGQVQVPWPYFLSFRQLPSQPLPSGHVYIPWPCFLLSSHCPSYFLPSGQVQIPEPSILPLTHPPLQTYPVAQQQVPSPFLLPCLNIPSYLLPSLYTSIPEPCCMSFYQQPSQVAPVLTWTKMPQPLALSSFHYPSQQSPLVCVNFPFPSALLLRHQPSQTAPSGHFCRPLPSRMVPSHYPSYSIPFLNLCRGFFYLSMPPIVSAYLETAGSTGSLSSALSLGSILDRLQCSLRTSTSCSSSQASTLFCEERIFTGSSYYLLTSLSYFSSENLTRKDSGMLSQKFAHSVLPIQLQLIIVKNYIYWMAFYQLYGFYWVLLRNGFFLQIVIQCAVSTLAPLYYSITINKPFIIHYTQGPYASKIAGLKQTNEGNTI